MASGPGAEGRCARWKLHHRRGLGLALRWGFSGKEEMEALRRKESRSRGGRSREACRRTGGPGIRKNGRPLWEKNPTVTTKGTCVGDPQALLAHIMATCSVEGGEN